LSILREEKETILLAEIAGLLHNIGKMDPNFLVKVVPQNEKRLAEGEVLANLQDIPDYCFERFASPDLELIQKRWSQRLLDLLRKARPSIQSREDQPNDKSRRVPLTRDALVDLLPDLGTLLEAEFGPEALPEEHVKALSTAIRRQGENGPLYECLETKHRKDRIPKSWSKTWRSYSELRSEIKDLQARIQELRGSMHAASGSRRKELGKAYGQLKGKRKQEEQQLDALSQKLVEGLKESWADPIDMKQEAKEQERLENRFRDWAVEAGDEVWPLADLLTLFWDSFFHKPGRDDYKRAPLLNLQITKQAGFRLPALLVLSHGEVSGLEKTEEEERTVSSRKLQSWPALQRATAFGRDEDLLSLWSLQSLRFDLIQAAVSACSIPSQQRRSFVSKAHSTLQNALGDTRWPINEIDLWDYASSIAALFKSGVARAVLDGRIPSVDAMRWRFLSVRLDGLAYLSQAHHVTDLLGRRDSLDVALEGVKSLLEQTYPLGNEVYRDENGITFVAPAWEDDRSLLGLQKNDKITLQQLIKKRFREASRPRSKEETSLPPLGGELEPTIHESQACRGKELKLGEYLKDRKRPQTADPERMAKWWQSDQGKQERKTHSEICSVCGVRPVGYRPEGVALPTWAGTKTAAERHTCCVCLHRRGRRARQWLKQELDTTIWADEVVDHNGRFALIIGRFDLSGWLNGQLIPTMQKQDSFARTQRCWESTEAFWSAVEKQLVPKHLIRGEPTPRFRLKIVPERQGALAQALGNYQPYELDIGGRRVSVIWAPCEAGGYLLTTENLADLVRRWGIPKKENDTDLTALQTWLKPYQGTSCPIYQPSGYNEPARRINQDVVFIEAPQGGEKPYTPQISLLTEPSVFMTLIPAASALDVLTAIRQKYIREMSKVQDRLSLRLGLVVAKRRTPLRAVMEAGREMLEVPPTWTPWTVMERPEKHHTSPNNLPGDPHFYQWWELMLRRNSNSGEKPDLILQIADLMGDGKTEDVWHAHFVTEDPLKDPNTNRFDPFSDVQHVSRLRKDDTVYVAPSTFDFEYLDTTARRFEIAYQTGEGSDGSVFRPTHPNRPFLLNDLDELERLWREMNKLLRKNQWMQIDGLIERKRREWQEPRGALGQPSDTFEKFVRDTFNNAEWKKKPHPEQLERLQDAARTGVLNDVIDLYHEALKEQSEEA
jgi:hypothetical protein